MSEKEITFRIAAKVDLPSIIRLLADDNLGSQREQDEDPLPESYDLPYEEINKDPNHELIVAELGGEGIGSEMMKWEIERSKARGAHIVQLTTHQSRLDAHRFYGRLGFKGTHLGMKLSLK